MGLGYLYLKYILLATLAVATVFLSLSIQEFGIYFGVLLLVGTILSAIYLFIHFDNNINQKVVLEIAIDGFAGLIIFTYPLPDTRFFMLDFSFWIAVMGIIHLSSGLFDHKESKLFWLYVLSGIMMIIFGFIIINYNNEYMGSVIYLIAMVLAYYALLNLYLTMKNKSQSID